jgi:exopolyphosphatase/guanosine-5'-triphosphate,3'-diphosphate pyrophosphatase
MAETLTTASVPEPDTQLAALDLGSNSFHLIVAQQHNGRIHVVDRLKEMVRLAAGLDANDTLSRQAMDRGIECLSRFGQRLRHLKSDSVRVVGTNTLRKARNGWEFISRAEAVIGHPIEIISGREEARLIYKGVCYAMGPAADRRLVIDIGGGSTELILGRGYEPELMDSLYMGCVSMSERYFDDGELKAGRFSAAELAARQELEPVEALYRRRGWDTVIGTSGTINAINDVAMQRGAVDGLTPTALTDITKALIAAKRIDHVSLANLPNERTPVFPGGVAILRGIFEGLGIERLTVSSGALREGLLQELIGRVRQEDVREHSVGDLARRYHVDELHAQKVAETAQTLLVQIAAAWGPDRRRIRTPVALGGDAARNRHGRFAQPVSQAWSLSAPVHGSRGFLADGQTPPRAARARAPQEVPGAGVRPRRGRRAHVVDAPRGAPATGGRSETQSDR